MTFQNLIPFLATIGTVLAVVIGWAALKGGQFFAARTGIVWIAAGGQIAHDVVTGLWAEMKGDVEAATADGVLTEAEKKKLKDDAWAAAQKQLMLLGPRALEMLEASVKQTISTKVETVAVAGGGAVAQATTVATTVVAAVVPTSPAP